MDLSGMEVSMKLSKEQVAAYTSALVQHTPNGILLVNRETHIYFVNPAFLTMFRCTDEEVLGGPARQFVRSDCFERAIASGDSLTFKETIAELEISYRASIFPIEGEGFYCGIFIDVSEEEKARQDFLDLKAQTLERAQQVISRQMQAAQEIANLLGETTAETKVLLMKLMSLYKEEGR